MTVQLASHLLEMVAQDVKIKQATVKEVIGLLTEGNTVPFIARYRKEQTGGLDEVEIKAIEDRYQYITQLEERKEEGAIKNIGFSFHGSKEDFENRNFHKTECRIRVANR